MTYLNRAEVLFSLSRLKRSQSVSLSVFPLGRYDSFTEFNYLCDVTSALFIIARCSVDSLFTFKLL